MKPTEVLEPASEAADVASVETEPAGWQSLPAEPAPAARAERRATNRLFAELPVQLTSIDPVRDSRTGELCYESIDDEVTLNLSRRGACLRCTRPPAAGTRMLLTFGLPGRNGRIEVVVRACWSRVEYVKGEIGARAVAIVGVEFVGGPPAALARYEQALETATRRAAATTVVHSEALG